MLDWPCVLFGVSDLFCNAVDDWYLLPYIHLLGKRCGSESWKTLKVSRVGQELICITLAISKTRLQ